MHPDFAFGTVPSIHAVVVVGSCFAGAGTRPSRSFSPSTLGFVPSFFGLSVAVSASFYPFPMALFRFGLASSPGLV